MIDMGKGSLSLPGWESTAGENSKLAVLTTEKVLEIRRLKSSKTASEVAAIYRVSSTCIRDIWTRKRWASVKDEEP